MQIIMIKLQSTIKIIITQYDKRQRQMHKCYLPCTFTQCTGANATLTLSETISVKAPTHLLALFCFVNCRICCTAFLSRR